MSRTILAQAAIEYPSSDAEPLAENDAQLAAILYAIMALKAYFEPRGDVYVSGDLLIYYEEGNPRVSVAPDVFVVFGVADRVRMNYKLWEEGEAPAFVLEVASRSTWREDLLSHQESEAARRREGAARREEAAARRAAEVRAGVAGAVAR